MDDHQLLQQWELEVKEIGDNFTCHPSQQRWSTDERWERLKMLGRGGYGEVWLQKCTTGPRVGDLRAVKEISKDLGQSSETKNVRVRHQELSALIKFSHQQYRDYFVSSFGWFQTSKSLFITMQYFPLGDLQSHIAQPLPDGEVSVITRQILRGLSFMHQNKFAHRDLKPANILVQDKGPDWWVKLSDFGCSKEATTLRTTVGTPPYWAPELCHIFTHADEESFDCVEDRTYSFEVDIWAVGVIAYRSVTGALPFGDNLRSQLYRYVRRGTPFPSSHLLTGEPRAFIEWLMSRSPNDRPTATQALAHNWISASSHADRSTSMPVNGGTPRPNISGTSGTRQASGRWTTATGPSPGITRGQTHENNAISGPEIGKVRGGELISTAHTGNQSIELNHSERSWFWFWRYPFTLMTSSRRPSRAAPGYGLATPDFSGSFSSQDPSFITQDGLLDTGGRLTSSTTTRFVLPPSVARPIITSRAEATSTVTIRTEISPVQTEDGATIPESRTCIAFSPDGKWLASACRSVFGGWLEIWSIHEQGLFQKSHYLKTECWSDSPTRVSFSSDGTQLVMFIGREKTSSTIEGLVAVTCRLDGQGQFRPFMSHYVSNSNAIKKNSMMKDGQRIAIVWVEPKSRKQRMTIWDANSQGRYDIFQEHHDPNRTFVWSADGEQYMGARFRRANGNHFFKSQAPGGTLLGHPLPAAYRLGAVAAFSSDGRWCAVDTTFGLSGFLVFEILPGGSWELNTSLGVPSVVLAVEFSPDSRTLAASCNTRKLIIWDLEDSKFKLRRQYSQYYATHLAFSPNSRLLAWGSGCGSPSIIQL